MIVHFGSCRIELVQGDITLQVVDAVVNAANSHLAGGGGVDGAIHRAAGPTLMQETRMLYPEGCPTGSAVATTAGRLKAKYVFHAVGPVWAGGERNESQLLASAYHACLDLAQQHRCASIAFPAISTGIYGYPIDLAAEVALGTVHKYLTTHQNPTLARFVLFGAGPYGAYSRVLESLAD